MFEKVLTTEQVFVYNPIKRTDVLYGVIDLKKRKYILKNKPRFFAFITITLVISASLFASTRAYCYQDVKYTVLTVREGDTLWSIASEHYKEGDIRKHIYDIKKLNKLVSSEIYAGTELIIPR